MDDIELNDGSPLKGHQTNQPVKLPKQDYYNYRDSLFTSTQDFYNFAESMNWPCFFTNATPAQWKVMYETYLWVKYGSDPELYQTLWEQAEGALDATLNDTLYQNTDPVFVAAMDEIFYDIDLIRANSNFFQDLDVYLEDKFDEVYEEDMGIQVQDEILSAICMIQMQSMLMQANAGCIGLSDWPDWITRKCVIHTAAGWFTGAITGTAGAGVVLATAAVITGPIALAAAGVVVAGVLVGTITGAVNGFVTDESQSSFIQFDLVIPEQPTLRINTQNLRI